MILRKVIVVFTGLLLCFLFLNFFLIGLKQSDRGITQEKAYRSLVADLVENDKSGEIKVDLVLCINASPAAGQTREEEPITTVSVLKRKSNHTLRYAEPTIRSISDAAKLSPAVPFAREAADGRQTLTKDETDVHTLRGKRMELDMYAFEEVTNGSRGRLLAPLPEGGEVELMFDEIRSRSDVTHSLVGWIDGEEEFSEVVIVQHDGVIHGTVATFGPDGGRTLEYRVLNSGYLMVREIDPSLMTAGCGNKDQLLVKEERHSHNDTGCAHVDCGHKHLASPMIPNDSEATATMPIARSDAFGKAISSNNTPSVTIDIVIGYARQTRELQGGVPQVEAFLIAAVDRFNNACNNSLIDARMVLLGTVEDPDYFLPSQLSPGDNLNNEASDLSIPWDGKLDVVSDLRTELGADLMSFIVPWAHGGDSGRAALNGIYSVNAREYMNPERRVFSHELGHNLGALHAWGDPGAANKEAHNYGWRFKPPGHFQYVRTVMTASIGDRSINARRVIPYFSNPDVLYDNTRTGQIDGYNATNDGVSDPVFVNHPALGAGFDGTNPKLGARNAHVIQGNVLAKSLLSARSIIVDIIEPISEWIGLLNTDIGLLLSAETFGFDEGQLSYQWDLLSGEGVAQFSSDGADSTVVYFSEEGSYQVRVLADDGVNQQTDELQVTVGPYNSPVPDPIGWWKFDETSGNNALDSSVSANHGSLSGFSSNPWQAGEVDNAIFFDQSLQSVIVPDSDELDGFAQATWTFWVNPSSESHSNRGIISKRLSEWQQTSYSFFLGFNNRLRGDIGGYNSQDRFTSQTSLPANQWTRVAIVFDGSLPSQERIKVYINGVLDSTHGDRDAAIANTSNALYFGSLAGSSGYYGGLDDVRIYDRALTVEQLSLENSLGPNYGPDIDLTFSGPVKVDTPLEVSATVQDDKLTGGSITHQWSSLNPNAPTPAPIPLPEIGWWKFDETSGNAAVDSTTPANNGSLLSWGDYPAPHRVKGKSNGALYFAGEADGVGQVVEVPDSDDLDGMSEATFAFWVLPAKFENRTRPLIGKRDSYTFYLYQNNEIAIVLGSYRSSDFFTTNASLPAGVWTHVALTFDGSLSPSERVRVYINGVLDGVYSEYDNRIQQTANGLAFGSWFGGGGFSQYYEGGLDDIRIYSRLLSQSDILKIMDEEAPDPWHRSKVSFTDNTALSTEATFSELGDHLVHLTASDGDMTTVKTTTVSIVPEIINSYHDWSTGINWQGHDNKTESIDNVHGIPNIILFAMDLDPLKGNHQSILPQAKPGDNRSSVRFTYRRSKMAQSIVFYPQYSNDLINWSPIDPDDSNVTITVLDSDVDGDNSAELIQVEVDVSNTNTQFFNLWSDIQE